MPSSPKLEQTLRRIALALPEVTEGVVCNRASFEAGKKRFLFLEAKEESCLVMLKLDDSLAEAKKLSATSPDCYRVGSTNWVTAIYGAGKLPPTGLLERWTLESYRLLVPKKIWDLPKPSLKAPKAQQKRKK
jgi:hypothetical protein